MTRRAGLAAAAVGFLLAASAAAAQTRVSGQAFGDYLYVVRAADGVEDTSAFQMRRVYLTADAELDSLITARVILEAENGTLTPNGRLSAFLKQAFVRFEGALPGASVLAGLAPTPIWGTTEAVWGYRSVEKTILDLRGLGAASDLGLSLQGSPAGALRPGFHLMFANGSGPRAETDRSKKAYAAIALGRGRWVFEPYADYDGGPGERDRFTFKLLTGWQEDAWALGAEAFHRTHKAAGPLGEDLEPAGFSAFGRTRLGSRWAAFARYDWFDADTGEGTLGYASHFVLAGIDYAPVPSVHVIPNVAVDHRARKSGLEPRLDSDVVARLTLAFTYPGPGR